MRAKSLVLGPALTSLLIVFSGPAALAGGYSVGVTGGLSAPTGDFKDPFKTGYDVGGTADHGIMPLIGLGIDAGYDSWKGKSAFWGALAVASGAAPGTTVDAKLTAIQYGVHGTLTPPIVGPIHPYGQVGVAGYNLKQTTTSNDPAFTGDFSKNLFGYNVGVGVNYTMIPTTSFGIFGQYNYVNSKNDFGSNATWINLNAMLTFHIPLVK